MCSYVAAQSSLARALSGVVVTQQDERLPGVTVSVIYQSGEQEAESDSEGESQVVNCEGEMLIRATGDEWLRFIELDPAQAYCKDIVHCEDLALEWKRYETS